MSDEDIRQLAITAANQTPLHLLSNMEARTVLEWLRGRGYLVKPKD